jgi:AsmA protein
MNKLSRNIAIGVAVVVIMLIALPMFINVNSFKPKIESELSAALGRKIQLGNLSLSVLGGSVSAENISIADDTAFSESAFLTAKSLKIGVQLMPLIFSKELRVTGITFAEPVINVLSNSKGAFNFQSLGGTSPKSENSASRGRAPKTNNSAKPGVLAALSIAELKLSDGKLLINRTNSSTKPLTIEKVNIEIKNFSATSQFPFTLSSLVADGGKLNLNGTAGPLAPAGTPVEAALKLSGLNLASLGVDPNLGLAGAAQMDGTLRSDGKDAKINGTVVLEKLRLSPKGKPADKQITVKFATAYNIASKAGMLSQGDVLVGKAVVGLTGRYESQSEATVLNMKVDAAGVSVDEIESILPAVGVSLPAGSRLKGGSLSSSLNVTGPTDKLVISGPVKLENSSLAGFDLGGKLGALSMLSGKLPSSKDTVIQSANLEARVSPEGSKLDNINVNMSAIGTITGSGTVSPNSAIDFHMIGHLAGVAGGLTQMTGLGGKGSGGIPFMVEGTTSDPKFVPDVKGMAGNAVQDVIGGKTPLETKNPTDALRGLFKKKP